MSGADRAVEDMADRITLRYRVTFKDAARIARQILTEKGWVRFDGSSDGEMDRETEELMRRA